MPEAKVVELKERLMDYIPLTSNGEPDSVNLNFEESEVNSEE